MKLTPDSLAAAAQRAKEREARARRPTFSPWLRQCPRHGTHLLPSEECVRCAIEAPRKVGEEYPF